jgi:hypothetical protein
MNTVLTWKVSVLGMVGLNLLYELHSFVDVKLNVACVCFFMLVILDGWEF